MGRRSVELGLLVGLGMQAVDLPVPSLIRLDLGRSGLPPVVPLRLLGVYPQELFHAPEGVQVELWV